MIARHRILPRCLALLVFAGLLFPMSQPLLDWSHLGGHAILGGDAGK